MRKRQTYLLITTLIVASIGVGTAYAIHPFGTEVVVKQVPTYADECPHGHNGFNCEPTQTRQELDELNAKFLQAMKQNSLMSKEIDSLVLKIEQTNLLLGERIAELEGNH